MIHWKIHSPRHCAPSCLSKFNWLYIQAWWISKRFIKLYVQTIVDNSIPKYSWIKFCTALWRLSAYNLVGPFLKVMSSIFTIGYSYSMAGSAWRRRYGGSCHCMTACACISCLLAIFARPRPFAVFTKNCELSFNGKKAYCAILRIGFAKLHALTTATLASPARRRRHFLKVPWEVIP